MVRIFLSYAREDIVAAERLYRDLNSFPRVQVWFDKRSIGGGQRWAHAIQENLRKSDYCLVLLSQKAAKKRGFYQKEIRFALDLLGEFPDDQTFLIPLRLDDCVLHFENMRVLQYIDMFPDWSEGFDKLATALRLHLSEPTTQSDVIVRLTSHQARFRRFPRMYYFVNLANRSNVPIEITHVWYEDSSHHIQVSPLSRRLPVRLAVNEAWCTWLPTEELPFQRQDDAYDRFRIRLSTGEVMGSRKEDTVPPVGPVPGGPIDPRDL